MTSNQISRVWLYLTNHPEDFRGLSLYGTITLFGWPFQAIRLDSSTIPPLPLTEAAESRSIFPNVTAFGRIVVVTLLLATPVSFNPAPTLYFRKKRGRKHKDSLGCSPFARHY
jgi:hypothetical protein